MEYPVVSKEYLSDVQKCRRKLRLLLGDTKGAAPLIIDLAWDMASGAYYRKSSTGGTSEVGRKTSSQRCGIKAIWAIIKPHKSVDVELCNSAINDLESAVRLLAPIKEQFPLISDGDFYQLAGVVAVEITGGPDIPFHPGREGKSVFSDSAHGPYDFTDLIASCTKNWSFVSLAVGRTMGARHKERSGSEGASTPHPIVFDNSLFKDILIKEKEGLPMSSDEVFLARPIFRSTVEKYVADEEALFEDYVEAYLQLSEVGFNWRRDWNN